MKVKGNIIIKDPKTTLFIYRMFSLALKLPVKADIELRIFYNQIKDILNKYAQILNNYSITRLSNIQVVDQCNRVAFEFLKDGQMVYQEGMIIPEIK